MLDMQMELMSTVATLATVETLEIWKYALNSAVGLLVAVSIFLLQKIWNRVDQTEGRLTKLIEDIERRNERAHRELHSRIDWVEGRNPRVQNQRTPPQGRSQKSRGRNKSRPRRD